MTTNHPPGYPARRSIRLPGYDYTRPGAYFVTICAHNRELLFGGVADSRMVLNRLGEIASESWRSLPTMFPNARLDECVVMPNHVHGILILVDHGMRAGGSRAAPTPMQGGQEQAVTMSDAKRAPLTQIVGTFKTIAGKRINEVRGTPGTPVWQRGYYEHIVRSEAEPERIRDYIAGNPGKWEEDEDNPQRQTAPARQPYRPL